MKKKYRLIIGLLLIFVSLFMFLRDVNYDLSEFKISIKSTLGQPLTLNETKSSNIYKAYNQIKPDTKIEDINNILHKKNKNIFATFESWHYPYGYIGVSYNENSNPRVLSKYVDFMTPYMLKIDEEELCSVFQCNSLNQIKGILGDSVAGLLRSYNENEIIAYTYSWGIKTSFSEKFVKDIEKKYDKFVNFPAFRYDYNNVKRKYILTVSINADDKIESFSLRYS
ncbi:MAG: hypothetical protein ACI8WT_001081 [Clostridium sp.]|jgi:hypothetical protein